LSANGLLISKYESFRKISSKKIYKFSFRNKYILSDDTH